MEAWRSTHGQTRQPTEFHYSLPAGEGGMVRNEDAKRATRFIAETLEVPGRPKMTVLWGTANRARELGLGNCE